MVLWLCDVASPLCDEVSPLRDVAWSKTQVTFHRSLDSGHCFTFWKVTVTLNLANSRPKVGFRPRVSQIEGYGYVPKGKTMTSIE